MWWVPLASIYWYCLSISGLYFQSPSGVDFPLSQLDTGAGLLEDNHSHQSQLDKWHNKMINIIYDFLFFIYFHFYLYFYSLFLYYFFRVVFLYYYFYLFVFLLNGIRCMYFIHSGSFNYIIIRSFLPMWLHYIKYDAHLHTHLISTGITS